MAGAAGVDGHTGPRGWTLFHHRPSQLRHANRRRRPQNGLSRGRHRALNMARERQMRPRRWPTPTTIIIASIGATLVAAALVFNARWFDRHFLPSFFLPRRWYVWIHSMVRWTMAIAGGALIFG